MPPPPSHPPSHTPYLNTTMWEPSGNKNVHWGSISIQRATCQIFVKTFIKFRYLSFRQRIPPAVETTPKVVSQRLQGKIPAGAGLRDIDGLLLPRMLIWIYFKPKITKGCDLFMKIMIVRNPDKGEVYTDIQMERKFPSKNVRKFGDTSRSCPLFRKLCKVTIFYTLSAKTSNFWAERFALCFSFWLDDCGENFPDFTGQVCTILANSKAREIKSSLENVSQAIPRSSKIFRQRRY